MDGGASHVLHQKQKAEQKHNQMLEGAQVPAPLKKLKSTYDLAVEGMPERIRLAQEIRSLFKPVDCYHPKYHKFRPDPLTQISNAYNRKVDSAEYWRNRTYYSRLYQSLCDAKIAQGDIQTIWGSPYVSAAFNWDKLPQSRQQAIRSQHPEIDGVAKGIACARSDFAAVLSKTAPETHRFVNEFAIPMTALASQPKPSPLADTAYRIVSANVNACHKFNDFTDRAYEIAWMYEVCADDNLLNAEGRMAFKEQVLDRALRPQQNSFLEIFSTVLQVAEITGIASTSTAIIHDALSFRALNNSLLKANIPQSIAKNINSKLKMSVHLAFEEAGMLTKDGKLTQKAIQDAEKIMSFKKLKNARIKEAMLKINPKGVWNKYQTKSINVIGNTQQKANIHFYMDETTGKTYLDEDFKIKINDKQGVGITKPEDKKYEQHKMLDKERRIMNDCNL